MSASSGKPIAIFYEHPEWFQPLFNELDRRGIPYVPLHAGSHGFDPEQISIPYSLILNRMSPSAYLRGSEHVIHYTRQFLAHLKSVHAPVINGLEAYELEISKTSQLDLLRQLGLRFPKTLVINHSNLAAQAARDLQFPVAIKPNIGGSGAKIQRFESLEALKNSAAANSLDLGIDHTALVQEFLPARGNHIVRVEFLDGRFLYAIRIHLEQSVSFNLCPADICSTDHRPVLPGAISPSRRTLRVEKYTPPQDVIEQVLSIGRAAKLDLGGVEYLVNDRDGEVYYYDINALSNFVADAEAIIGFNPHAKLVDFLVQRHALTGIRQAEFAGVS